MKYPHIWRAVASTPWAILPERLMAMLEALEARGPAGPRNDPPPSPRARGEEDDGRRTTDDVQAAVQAAAQAPQSIGGVAVVPVRGVVQQRPHWLEELFGISVSASTERIGAQVAAAANDPAVSTILLEIDSPGGTVMGVTELFDRIYRARSSKRIVAVANSLAASAAYHIASAADEIVVTPSGLVGSIGVFSMHEDISALAEQMGVKVTFISAGRYKTEGNEFEPLSDEARAAIQHEVDNYYGMFVRDVARGRGVSVKDVTGGFGEGRVVGAADAKRLGMVDRVATLDETLARLAGGKGQRSGARADAFQDDWVVTLNGEPVSLDELTRMSASTTSTSSAVILSEDSQEGPPTVPPLRRGEEGASAPQDSERRRRLLLTHP